MNIPLLNVHKPKLSIRIAAIAAFGVIGAILLLSSFAAQDGSVNFEAENSDRAGASSMQSGGDVSGGSYVTLNDGPAPTPTPPVGTDPPEPVVNVKDHGAKGDGSTNDTAAIMAAIGASNGGSVYFPAGTYNHDDIIHIKDRNNVKLWGYTGAVLHSTNQARASVMFENGSGHGVFGLKLTSNATSRSEGFEAYMISMLTVKNTEIKDVEIDNGSAAAIYAWHAEDYRITGTTIKNNYADGIHSTAGSKRGYIANNTVSDNGDDCYAVVSNVQDATMASDIVIENNTCIRGGARGLAVIGGRNIEFRNNIVDATVSACIIFAAEGGFNSYGPKNVKFLNNTLTNCNTRASRPDEHAAIFGHGRSGSAVADGQTYTHEVEDVLVEGNIIKDTKAPFWHVAYLYGHGKRITYKNNVITGTDLETFHMELGAENYNIIGNTFNGAPVPDKIGF